MLSVKQCRGLLRDEGVGLSDAQVERLRDDLANLAGTVIETARAHPLATKAARRRAVENLPDEIRDEFEERAAIMEFEAGLTRAAAEGTALVRLVRPSKAS